MKKGEMKCFVGDLIQNHTIKLGVNILDKQVLEYLKQNQASEKISFSWYNPSGYGNMQKQVSIDEKFEITIIENGEHQGCMMLPDGAFDVNSYHQVKTEILSFIEQRIEQKDNKTNQAQSTKQQEDKNEAPMHGAVNAATTGHFQLLRRRVYKIKQVLEEIIDRQNVEREKEESYKENLKSFSSAFFRLVMGQILVLIGCGIYAVFSLKQFFLKKHIL
ncbi:ensosomal cargo [Stylonychia lemnae]|uniref:Ensosomal cargo n=1 Tax=Stylonychia lemnae TaxID=5949 RepID=A0A078ABP6_STYLE|nr:ensosomal cargo [Stylonychia lemnae]|eukprot:CDW79007.1 ensosomal cargo [Stylonychia lemnae]